MPRQADKEADIAWAIGICEITGPKGFVGSQERSDILADSCVSTFGNAALAFALVGIGTSFRLCRLKTAVTLRDFELDSVQVADFSSVEASLMRVVNRATAPSKWTASVGSSKEKGCQGKRRSASVERFTERLVSVRIHAAIATTIQSKIKTPTTHNSQLHDTVCRELVVCFG